MRPVVLAVAAFVGVALATPAVAAEPDAITCQYRGDWDDEAASADEQACLKRRGGIVRRVGDLVVVRMLDGSETTLTFFHDNPGSGAQMGPNGYTRTRFDAYWPRHHLVFFATSLGGDLGGYSAVNLKTGHQHLFDNLPSSSPTGRRLIDMGTPQAAKDASPAFSIQEINVRKKFVCDFKNCRRGSLSNPRWLNDDHVTFDVQDWTFDKPARPNAAEARFDGKTWQMTWKK